MPIHNDDIADVFDEIADLLEIQGENPFRIRAYRNAAREVRALPREVVQLLEKGEDLTRLPGIGEALAGKIEEMARTGSCRALKKLEKQLPADLTELLRLPGLGPKRVHALHYDLDIHTPEQLYRAAKDGRLRQSPGFGAKTEERILEALDAHLSTERRFKLATAARYAESLVAYLEQARGVDRVLVSGSYRRCRETVGDLDILVTATDPNAVMDRFVDYDEVERVQSKGTTRATLYLKSGLQVDLRVVERNSFGAALHYFTGSKAHNIAVRTLARQRGLKVNEYGVFRGTERIAGETEESVFAAVGLPYIAPELRENRGEIEAARNGLLPKLVELADLRGDLHCHTVATDGHGTLAEMVHAARAQGLRYIAITEHSKRLRMAHGLDSQRLLQQIEEIDRLNQTLEGFRVLKGIEVDILEDGGLDLPDEVLGRLDLVIGAVHSRFHLTRAQQTRRILKAMDHPHFTILAHPSGRLIDEREPYDVDMARLISHARDRGCYLELNAHPERLDLLDIHCQMAREEGVLVSIDSDAHNTLDFANLRYGVGQARRGWLEAKDVLNARPLNQLLPLLRRTM
ncbi:MAG: DNA polymerase/3'-5' exonuclease PolX [Pseudomonadota bacterium]|nr:DNA polymerase/3'-5' exonuclease PolX [Pseudomonadota bacterium]